MSLTLETLTLDRLTAQPFVYESDGNRSGLTYRAWQVAGLLLPAEWVELLGIYETWRDARLAEDDTSVSLEVGATVEFSGSFAGVEWTEVECWFDDPPSASTAGAYLSVTFKLIDAEQALDVLLRSSEIATETSDANLPNYGTAALGDATLNLIEPPDGYLDSPVIERTAAGGLVLKGPLGAVRIQRLRGYTTPSGWDDVRDWYEDALLSVPQSGEPFPISEPTMEPEVIIAAGVRTTRCLVSVDVWEP